MQQISNGVSVRSDVAVLAEPKDLPTLDVDPVDRLLPRHPHGAFAQHSPEHRLCSAPVNSASIGGAMSLSRG